MSIGMVLSELLKKYSLNAQELERLTGVPASTIYRLLKNNDGNPTIEVLKKLSCFFQITVSQLIGEEPIGCKQIPLIPSLEICSFLNLTPDEKAKFHTIPIDFPINNKSFATLCQDKLMEPFILMNSIIIVDPDREITNKDFILLIKRKNESPIIRQIIKDDEDIYLRVMNCNLDLKKISFLDYYFIGVIVHYRTNLFDIKNSSFLDISKIKTNFV